MAVDPNIKKKADDIRNKIYGKEVRESLASGLEEMSSDVVENEGRQSVVEGRQDSVESQFQDVIENTTDKDVISAPEIIAARDGESNLKARLDKENARLAQAEQEIGNKINTKSRGKRKFITLFSDDARRDDYDVLRPICNSLGIPMCLGAVTNKIGTGSFLSKAELMTMQNEGHEISSHSADHHILTELTTQQIEYQLSESAKYLRENGFKGRSFAVPHSFWDERVKRIATKYYRAMRTSEKPPIIGHNRLPLETYELKGIWFRNSTEVDSIAGYAPNQFEYYKYYIDKLMEDDAGWLIISTHGEDITSWGYEELFEQVMEYASQVAEVVTFNEALDEMDNLIEDMNYKVRQPYADHFAIGADGVPKSNRIATITLHPNSVSATTPLSEFENDYVSFCNIANVSATGMPGDKAGLLITHKFVPHVNGILSNEYFYSYQTYKRLDSNRMFYRRATSMTSWGDWEEVAYTSQMITTINNEILSTTRPKDFVDNNITFSEIPNLNKAGFPSNYGMLITYRFNNRDSYRYTYQTYIPTGSNVLYTRKALSDTAWGSWESEKDKSDVIITPNNTYNGLTPISSFPVKITYTDLRSSQSEGLPETAGGILITYKIRSEPENVAYNWQEFKKYNSFDKYIRYANSSDTWSAWKKFTLE